MGLGKTIQAIASMSAFDDDWPLLIIAPTGAILNWETELLRWLRKYKKPKNPKKDEKILVLNENKIKMLTKKKEDAEALLKDREVKVVITSFKIASENKTLKTGLFKAVIVDESHNLKNESTQTTKRISALLVGAHRIILLSGTPALSKPGDLKTQLELVAATKDERHDTSTSITECYSDEKTGYVEKLLLSLELGLRVQTYIIRRLKGSTCSLCSLPPKKRKNAYVDEDEDIKSKTQSLLRSSNGKQARLARRSLERGNTKEAEMASELLGLGSGEVEAESNDQQRDKSEFMKLRKDIGMVKARQVVPVIEEFIEENEGKKLVIFAHHIDVLDYMEKHCESYIILTKSVWINQLRFVNNFPNNSTSFK